MLKALEEWKKEDWKSRFDEILDSFEDFLMERPEPPKAVIERFGGDLKKFDYLRLFFIIILSTDNMPSEHIVKEIQLVFLFHHDI